MQTMQVKCNIDFCDILFTFTLLLSFLTTAQTLPKTPEGWTVFSPSDESLIVYVSSSDGNDETAQTYTKTELGNSPFSPPENILLRPFKTFDAAFKRTRNNKPDWILVKRGDEFFESIKVKNGKSLTEPSLISTYGKTKTNPRFNTGKRKALSICCKSFSFIAVQGLDFYAHTRDPKSKYFTSSEGAYGLGVYISEEKLGNGLLIEGNRFNFYTNNVVQGLGTLKNIMIRRNSFFDNYSTTSHSQGFYAANVSLTLEENIFDHNGWLVHADQEHSKAQGAATMFNHNTYFANSKNVTFINNIFIRSSSIHNKWTANNGAHSSSNVAIKNNLYLDGEIGISAGGNKPGSYRFNNYQISDNVMLNIGRSQPTNRALGWGLEIKDWDGGIVKNNYFLNQVTREVTNSYGINISGTTQNLIITNNVFNSLHNANALILENKGVKKEITINNNYFTFTADGGALIKNHGKLNGYTFYNNKYFHQSGRNHVYTTKSKKNSFWQNIFTFNDDNNFVDWVSQTNEKESQWIKPNIKEERTIESYLKSIKEKENTAHFISKVRSMSFLNWDDRFTAEQVNKYIKLGYTINEHIDE